MLPGGSALGQRPLGGGPSAFATPSIGWLVPFGVPVRYKRDPRANLVLEYQTIAFNPQPFVSFGYFESLSEPKRDKPRSPAALTPYHFWQPAPSPFVATGWYEPLSEPVRIKPRLREALQMFAAYQASPIVVTPFAWYANLSEPVRIKPGLKTALQQAFTNNANWIPSPTALVEGWYTWLSEPKRFPKGLKVEYQKAFWAPERLLPTPNVTVILNTTEIDTDNVGIAINVVRSNPPVSARVSIVEIGTGLSPTSVIEQ